MNGVLVLFCAAVAASCLGYNIDTCNYNKKLQVDETRQTILTCSGRPSEHNHMIWKLRRTDGRESLIGMCTWSSVRCNVNDGSYALTWTQDDSSQLTIRDDHRNKIAGTVTCAGLYGGRVVNAATCDVRVVYTDYGVTNCQTSVSTTKDWTVSGSCDVTKIFALDDKYSCDWTVSPSGKHNSIPGTMGFSTVTDHGVEFQRVTCFFKDEPLPSEDGVYSYIMTIDPARNRNEDYTGKPLIISSAKGPPVLHNCPDYVIEGGDAHCTCQASASEPPAVVTWSPGVSGVVSNTSSQTLSNVRRLLNGVSFVCRQYWGGLSTGHMKATVYTLKVRYPPPSPPLIQGALSYTEGDSLHLTCTVTGGNPPVAEVALSCGAHSGAGVTATYSRGEHRVRNITISNLDVVSFHGSSCQCSATWMDNPGMYTSTSSVTIVVQVEHSGRTTHLITTATAASSNKTDAAATTTTTTTKDNNSDDDAGDGKLAATVGGATGGVAAVIIVVLVIVIILVLWKKRCDPLYARPSSARGADDHIYTDLDQHITPPDQPPTQRNHNYAGNEQLNSAERQYENTAVNKMATSPEKEYENTVNTQQEASPYVQYESTPI